MSTQKKKTKQKLCAVTVEEEHPCKKKINALKYLIECKKHC